MALYLLLNPTPFDPQALSTDAIRQHQQRPHTIATFDNPAAPAIVSRQLRLQPAPEGSALHQESLSWPALLDERYPGCVGGWIASPLPLESLAMSFQQALVHRKPEGKRGLIRLFDPLVLQHLEASLLPEQLGALLPFADQWTYSDLNGALHTLTLTARASRFALTASQWAALSRLETTRTAVQTLKKIWPGPLPFDVTVQVDRFVEEALAYGIDDEEDLLNYVQLGMTLEDGFDQLPVFKRLLAHVRQGHRFSTLLALQSQRGWPELPIKHHVSAGN